MRTHEVLQKCKASFCFCKCMERMMDYDRYRGKESEGFTDGRDFKDRAFV